MCFVYLRFCYKLENGSAIENENNKRTWIHHVVWEREKFLIKFEKPLRFDFVNQHS